MIFKSKALMPLIFIMGLLLGAFFFSILNTKNDIGYRYYFKVVGDVENPIHVRNMEDHDTVEINYDDKKTEGIPLSELINEVKPLSDYSTILFVGTDGLTSEINLEGIEESYINFSEEHGWNAMNFRHPISSNIKHLKEIVIVSSDEYNEFGVNLFTEYENIKNITCGQLYKNGVYEINFEGTSKVEIKDTVNDVTVYTTEKRMPLDNVFSERNDEDIFVVFGKDGRQVIESATGYLKMNENTISYVSQSKNTEVEEIVGIYCGRLLPGITDTFYDTDYYLKNGRKVMVFLLDGLSYEQYEYAKEEQHMPYMGSLETAAKAFSAYKPVTNTGFTTMITGKTPDVHGVHDRSIRDYNAVSIFGKALEYQKNAVLIEGDIKILNTEIQPILNIDANKDGDIDDEVFQAALSKAYEIDLCFIHFHGIDDRGHTFGPMSEEVNQYISRIDGYVKTLSNNWEGIIIITADHGMHKTEEGGRHGICRYEDMIVPYIVIQK